MKALWFLQISSIYLAAMLWFGIVGLIMTVLAPLLLRRPMLNFLFGYTFAWPLQKIFGYQIELKGAEHLHGSHGPLVMVCNHQSALDLITYGTVLRKDTVYIGKKELWFIPIFNVFFWAGGNIFINRQHKKSAVASLGQARSEMLRRKLSVWVFPEGTRSRGKVPLLPFKRGAFHLAIACQCPVVAFVSQPLRSYYRHEEHRIIPGKLRVRALPPYPTTGLTESDVTMLADRVRADMLQAIAEMEKEIVAEGRIAASDLYRPDDGAAKSS